MSNAMRMGSLLTVAARTSHLWARRSFPAALLAVLATVCVPQTVWATRVILVTSLQDKIGSTGGCSLKEAIYAANFHVNLAIDSVNPDGSDDFVATSCVAQGSGDDAIVQLPVGATFFLLTVAPDAHSPLGPAAMPMVISKITIEGNGSTLQWAATGVARALSVGTATIALPGYPPASGTGNLSVRNLTIRGFLAKGGDGGFGGGGGGMGAGGAFYVAQGAGLTLDRCTLAGNRAIGGNGGDENIGQGGGGGGGLGGNGGAGAKIFGFVTPGSGGGGGSRGDGGGALGTGGGGGGTWFAGGEGGDGDPPPGGLLCGGGAGPYSDFLSDDGHDAFCPGGGGGGAGSPPDIGRPGTVYGGDGQYGGGGGGSRDQGGHGGFGAGGGGCGKSNSNGGDGGFGGGGGGGQFGYEGHGGSAGFGGGIGRDDGIGGGGAGFGGAVFNENGTVVIENSTLSGNQTIGGRVPEDCHCSSTGDGHGGAVFSLNGSTTILNSTIAANLSSGTGSGVYVYQQNPLPGYLPPVTTTFILRNTVISGNAGSVDGATRQCTMNAAVITGGDWRGNLIQNNDPDLPCDYPAGYPSGIVSTLDPQLGPVQLNGGSTPTMALLAGSPAIDSADPSTSLATDQRGIDRPQGGGFDIGAYESCPATSLGIAHCVPLTNAPPPPTVTLTVQVSPAAGGTTSPAPGQHDEDLNSIIPLSATANAGFAFVGWNGNAVDPLSPLTTVVMNQSQTVTANFTACVQNLGGRGTASSRFSAPRVDLTWTPMSDVGYYNVLRGTSSGGPYANLGQASGSAAAYTDKNALADGHTYFYVLTAVSPNGVVLCNSNEAQIYVP